jgi:hypothetical protein
MNKVLLELLILVITIFVFFFTYFFVCNETRHWNGITDKEDTTKIDKIVNRIYFTLSTATTVGFGHISPKTILCKIIVSVQLIVILLEVLLALIYK